MSKCRDTSNDVFVKTWNPNSEPWITEFEAFMEGLAIQEGYLRVTKKTKKGSYFYE